MLTIRASLQRVGGTCQLVEPKTARSRRTIPIPSFVATALVTHRQQQRYERLLAGSRWCGDELGLVFPTTIGTPQAASEVTGRFQRLAAEAGLPRKRFHDLRHTAATLLLTEGVPLRVVMEVLGHSTITVTANVYAHVMPAMTRDAAERMQAAIGD